MQTRAVSCPIKKQAVSGLSLHTSIWGKHSHCYRNALLLSKQVFSQWRSLVLPQNERLTSSSRVGYEQQIQASLLNSIFQRTASICFYSAPGDGGLSLCVLLHASALTRMVANHTLNSASYENSVTTTPCSGQCLRVTTPFANVKY